MSPPAARPPRTTRRSRSGLPAAAALACLTAAACGAGESDTSEPPTCDAVSCNVAEDAEEAMTAEWATWSGETSLLDDLSARFPETPTYGGDGRRCLEEARPAADALFADLHTVEETMTAF